jgi:CheY-like chemotaxis protein
LLLILLVRCANLPIRNWEGCRNEDGVPPTVTESEAAGIRHEVGKDEARMTKILLVDDSKFLRLATERALARAGYEVSTAMDGANALEIAREKKPDLILLDMLLPKMTGPDVLKALKNDPATAGIAVGGIHRAVAEKRGPPGAGWGFRISGQSGTGAGQGERGVAGGAGADRAALEARSSGGDTGEVRVGRVSWQPMDGFCAEGGRAITLFGSALRRHPDQRYSQISRLLGLL